MPKIVGLLTGINYVEDWIEPAIQQALNICDEVIVSIGANNQQLEVLQDSTLEKAKAFGDRIKMVAAVKGKTFAQGKAPTLNNMLKMNSVCFTIHRFSFFEFICNVWISSSCN